MMAGLYLCTRSMVSWKSSSVSPGKPQMMSWSQVSAGRIRPYRCSCEAATRPVRDLLSLPCVSYGVLTVAIVIPGTASIR